MDTDQCPCLLTWFLCFHLTLKRSQLSYFCLENENTGNKGSRSYHKKQSNEVFLHLKNKMITNKSKKAVCSQLMYFCMWRIRTWKHKTMRKAAKSHQTYAVATKSVDTIMLTSMLMAQIGSLSPSISGSLVILSDFQFVAWVWAWVTLALSHPYLWQLLCMASLYKTCLPISMYTRL